MLVADRKFIVDEGERAAYGEKLYEVAKGVIIGFSGNRGAFELFRTQLDVAMDDVRDLENEGTRIARLLLLISETMSKVSTRYRNYDEKFEALVAAANPAGKAMLKHFYPDGKFESVDYAETIGTGAPYAKFFLNQCWSGNHSMQTIAELGYFCIRCIQDLRLNNTVSLASDAPEVISHYPQTWFIPDRSDKTYQISDKQELLPTFEKNVLKRMEEIKKVMKKLFPFNLPPELLPLLEEKQKRLIISAPSEIDNDKPSQK